MNETGETNMWHRVADVAKERNVPEAELLKFARDNESKYSVIYVDVGQYPMVSTWNVDDLVRDFRKQWRG